MWLDVVTAHERMENLIISLRDTRHNNSQKLMKCLGFGAEDDKVCACLSPHFTCGVACEMIHPVHLSTHHLRRCTLSYCEAGALITTCEEQKRASQSVAI